MRYRSQMLLVSFAVLFCGGCVIWNPPVDPHHDIAIGIHEAVDPEDSASEELIPGQKEEADQPPSPEKLQREIDELLDLLNELQQRLAQQQGGLG